MRGGEGEEHFTLRLKEGGREGGRIGRSIREGEVWGQRKGGREGGKEGGRAATYLAAIILEEGGIDEGVQVHVLAFQGSGEQSPGGALELLLYHIKIK